MAAAPRGPPKFRRGRRQTICSRAIKLEADWKPTVVPKEDSIKASIRETLKGNILFKGMDDKEKEIIVDAMDVKMFEADDVIIKQGDVGDFFYVVDNGHCDIFVEGIGKVAESGAGGSFGELALMYNAPRAATVIATEVTKTWAVDQVTFKKTLMANTMSKRRRYETFLKKVKIMGGLNEYERLTVADALAAKVYDAGEAIITEGEDGTDFYIIESGEVKCEKVGVDGEVSRRLKSGDYFGERALLTSEHRAATVTAVSYTRCQTLDRKTFKRLLGPLEDTFKGHMELYEKYKDMAFPKEDSDSSSESDTDTDTDKSEGEGKD